MRLAGIASALPTTKYATAEILATWSHPGRENLARKIGVNARYWLQPTEKASDLAAAAMDALFKNQANFTQDKVKILAVVGQVKDQRIPHMAAKLQAEMNLPYNCMTFDLSLACSGWVAGMVMVSALMQQQNVTEAILVTCDPYSRVVPQGTDLAVLFGDAATATRLSAISGATVGLADFGTDGKLAGALATHHKTLPWKGCTGEERDSDCLAMDGASILRAALDRVPTSVDICLQKNNLTREDVDFWVFHQASAWAVRAIAEILKIPPERCPIHILDTGNTVSSSIPLVLEDLANRTDLRGKTVCVSGFGAGFSWGTTILRY